MQKKVGLHMVEGRYVYRLHGCFINQAGIHNDAASATVPFAAKVDSRLFTERGVQDVYEAIMEVAEYDSRALCLMAIVTAGWCTVFAEQLKRLQFQVPAFAFVGPSDCGKSTFLTKNRLLVPGNKHSMSVSATIKKPDRQKIIDGCRYGQLIISDLHGETSTAREKNVVVLDETVRPAAEEPDTVGCVLISAESGILTGKAIIPSLRNRIISIPAGDLLATKENIEWSMAITSHCLSGNVLFTVLPQLIEKLNAEEWEKSLLACYYDYRDATAKAGSVRLSNQRFLMIYSHREILDAAVASGYISQEQHDVYFARIGRIAEWLYRRQNMLTAAAEEERMRLALEKLTPSLRYVRPKELCNLYGGEAGFECERCTYLRRYQDPNVPRCNFVKTEIDHLDVILRADELGVLIDTETIEAMPRNSLEKTRLLVVRRKAFLEQLGEALEDVDYEYRFSGREYNGRDLLGVLREQGLLAYTVRDSERGQYDYAERWPAAKNIVNHRIILDSDASVLILQFPADWKADCFENTASLRLLLEKDVSNPLQLARLNFKKIRQ